jgi:V8-like Glu-specific endopeptidase
LLLVAVLGCEQTTEDDNLPSDAGVSLSPLVGGTPTGYREWTGVLGMRIPGDPGFYWVCTGTLLHPSILLTAGHCVFVPESNIDLLDAPEEIKVFGGSQMNSFYSRGADIVLHPKWSGDINDLTAVDLAIIRLEDSDEKIETFNVCNSEPKVDQKGWLVGYGVSDADDMYTAETHRKGESTVLRVMTDMFFELGNSTGTCLGDSGGPFFTREGDEWVVSGVTSFGTSEECTTEDDNWEVNVFTYRKWILDTADELINDIDEDRIKSAALCAFQARTKAPMGVLASILISVW